MNEVLINGHYYPINFTIKNLLALDSDLYMSLDELLFEVDITEDLQVIIIHYGIDRKVSLKDLCEWYTKLSPQEIYNVNTVVNGTLLESMGVGRENTNSSNTNEETETKTFKETMEDLLCYLIANVGISMQEFYSSTPNLMYKLSDAYFKRLEFEFNLNTQSMINAWGLTHSKKFKPMNPFNIENNSPTKKVDLNKKQEELDYLFNLGEVDN